MDVYNQSISLSLRERYLITQALVLGIEKLAEARAEPGLRQELSNMNDMGELLKSPFFAPFTVAVLETQNYNGQPCTTATTIVYYEEDEDLPF